MFLFSNVFKVTMLLLAQTV